ncbi:MAG: ribosome hibernation-promoting factor, HPF/YfiA family [Candidatus Cyclobacteriaceae bacterium M2_1C_046]
MRIDIQTVGFEADQQLLDHTDEKISGLTKYFENITGIDVYLKSVQNDRDKTKIAEIKVFIPGEPVYGESQTDTFHGALDQAVEKVKKQLKKRNQLVKDKRQ